MSWEINGSVKLALGILGNVTALGLFLIPVKTVLLIIRSRSTEDFSVVPYIVALLNCALWTFYGLPIIGEGRTLVITINAVGVGLEAIYVLVFFIHGPPNQKIRTCAYLAGVALFFGAVVAVALAAFQTSASRSLFVGIINDVVTIAMYAAPLEIMWLVIRTRSVKYMPFYLSVLGLANGLAWTVYSVYVRDIYIGIPNVIGVLLGLFQLLLYTRYHHIEVVTESKRHMLSMSDRKEDATDPGNNTSASEMELEKGHGEKS